MGTVDNFGRRPLLLVGISMMFVGLLLLGVGFRLRECADSLYTVDTCWKSCTPPFNVVGCTDNVVLPGAWGWVCLISFMLVVAGYQLGFGPIAWLLISEIFPLQYRGSAMSVAATTNFVSNIAVTFTFTMILDALGYIAFWLYGALCLVSLVFVITIVPETKGLTLEQIEQKLKN